MAWRQRYLVCLPRQQLWAQRCLWRSLSPAVPLLEARHQVRRHRIISRVATVDDSAACTCGLLDVWLDQNSGFWGNALTGCF